MLDAGFEAVLLKSFAPETLLKAILAVLND
jgi:DNA-binding NarL/FixJ family response regulator